MKSLEEMREFLEKLKRPYEEEIWGRPFEKSCHHDLEIIDAILAALAGPSEEERKILLRFVNTALCGPSSVEDVQNQRTLKQIDIDKLRALILGSQGGTVSPDTRVSPHGETGGAVLADREKGGVSEEGMGRLADAEDARMESTYGRRKP